MSFEQILQLKDKKVFMMEENKMFIPSENPKSLASAHNWLAEKENVKDGLDFVLYIIWRKKYREK